MNAAQTITDPTPASVAVPSPHSNPADTPAFDLSRVSALVDGEASDQEWALLLAQTANTDDSLDAWHRYHVIGDVLRAAAPAQASQAPQDFLAGIRARLQTEDLPHAQQPVQPAVPALVAPAADLAHVRAPAANDALFRWKLVAGLASLAAVMAVSWTVLGSAGVGGQTGAASQWALLGNNPGAATRQAPESVAVLVSTPQGPVMRDPQLEALMAEHRQYGGMSALQMPAGFLRNATYDATGR